MRTDFIVPAALLVAVFGIALAVQGITWNLLFMAGAAGAAWLAGREWR